MDDTDVEPNVNSNLLTLCSLPWSQSGFGNSIIMSSNSSHLQREGESEGDSDEESLEYYYNFGELTKKRGRVTILESTQQKISRWESPFKKTKSDIKKSWRASGMKLEDMKTIYVDCNSLFPPEADVKEHELDSFGTGKGSYHSAKEAELGAIKEGIKKAISMECTYILLLSDNQNCVAVINGDGYAVSWNSMGLVDDIRQECRSFISWRCIHIRRQSNGMAHLLAQAAHNLK